MLFYRAIDKDGKLKLAPTQEAARKINPQFDSWEFPTAKAEIQEVLQDLIDRAEGGIQPAPIPEPVPTDPHQRCPKCKQTQRGAEVLADIRVDELVCNKLDHLPDRTILRVMDNLVSRVLEVARKAETLLKAADGT
jgi:hypothetical protein